MPVQVGPVRIIPSISGEAAHYGQAADGEPLTRLLGQAGIGASLSAWRVDPSIQSSLLNVRGLAHKVEWNAEYFYADSNTNLDELPLYDPLDDQRPGAVSQSIHQGDIWRRAARRSLIRGLMRFARHFRDWWRARAT